MRTSNEQGFVFTEILAALVIVSALMAMAIPNISLIAKRIATKQEMKTVINMLQLYEVESGMLPSSLSSLSPTYFATGSGYDKDGFNVNYTWTVSQRKLCSTSFSPAFCMIVP